MLSRAEFWSAAVACWVAAALVSCTSPAAARGLRIDPAFESAFESLELALSDHQDELARRILERTVARGPEGDTLEHLESFRRVLDGRDLGRELDLRLEVREHADGRFGVRLLASYPGDDRLRVASGPGQLRLLLTGVGEAGLEQRAASTSAVLGTEQFEVRSGRVTRIKLGDYELPTGAAMAVRASWDLTLMPGEVVRGKRRGVPINEFHVRGVEVVRLAAFLPTGPVAGEELARYLEGESFSTAAMLERAVRIPPEERAAALDLLEPVVASMTTLELERTVPALRWLSGNWELGGDPRRWRAWMVRRAQLAELESAELEQNEELALPSADGS